MQFQTALQEYFLTFLDGGWIYELSRSLQRETRPTVNELVAPRIQFLHQSQQDIAATYTPSPSPAYALFVNANTVFNLKLVICIWSKILLSGPWTLKVRENTLTVNYDDKVFWSEPLGNTDSQLASKF